MIGDPDGIRAGGFQMQWCEALAGYQDSRFTLIENAEMAVAFYRRLYSKSKPFGIGDLRGRDLACWCRLDQPCHADVLLEMANG
jgi:hypothetical protein